jgi:ribosomal protein L7/L12
MYVETIKKIMVSNGGQSDEVPHSDFAEYFFNMIRSYSDIECNYKVSLIKIIRNHSGCSLRAAKIFVEDALQQYRS